MLIIKEDTLIHTDSSSDVIEHYGIKGMRWGIRSRHKVLKDLYSSYKEAQKARQKGKKINKKVSDKLQKKTNDNYDMYSGHRKLVSSYYNSYTNQ